MREATGSNHELKVMPENNQSTESITAELDPLPKLGRARFLLKKLVFNWVKPHKSMTYFLLP
jgi:hypothetical protein